MSHFTKLANGLAIAALMAAAGCSQQADEVDTESSYQSVIEWEPYANLGPWAVLRYAESGAPEQSLGCSAVNENIMGTTLRVAVNADSYSIGINGGSPNGEDDYVDMKFYVDGDTSNTLQVSGTYEDDPAYEYDHWLGMEFPKDDPRVELLTNSETLTVSTYNPGNRTGNDWPESHFEMFDGELLKSVLDECMQNSSAPDSLLVQNWPPGECGNSQPLTATGMCKTEARTLMHIPKGGDEPYAPDECVWDVADAALPGEGAIVYRAVTCGEDTSKLIPTTDTYPAVFKAEVSIVPPNVSDDIGFETKDAWAEPVVTIYQIDPDKSHYEEIPRLAKEAAEAAGVGYADECALEWDEYAGLDAINGPVDMESEYWSSPCGPLGASEGYGVFWNYLQPGYVAAYRYPVDGVFGIDWKTITLVPPEGDGG